MKTGVLPGAWTTVEYDGKRYGMPWILDTKYLFYNKEILEKAGIKSAAEDLGRACRTGQDHQGQGLARNADRLELVAGRSRDLRLHHAGQRLWRQFLKDGKPAFQTGGGLDALKYMVDSYTSGLTNPNSKEFLEEDVRKVFQNGEAAFALNWTYMYNMANDPQGQQGCRQGRRRSGAGRCRQERGFGRQRLDGPRHHLDQQASGRSLEIHHLHDLAGDAEPIRQAQPADLGLVL